jgi:hypothetical protein
MILFAILLSLILVVAAVALVFTILAGGSILAIFGDLIVFGLIVYWIIKLFRKKKK